MTYAQHSVVQKIGRDKYYTKKMMERFSTIDRELAHRKDSRHLLLADMQSTNKILAADRSDKKLKMAQTIRDIDNKFVAEDLRVAAHHRSIERQRAEDRRAGYQQMIKEYLRDKEVHRESQFNGLQPLELKLNRPRLTEIGVIEKVRCVPKK